MRFSRLRVNQRRAASAVEFAMVAPVMLIFILGLLEYARLMFMMQMLNNAAREGARYAVVNTTHAQTADIQTYVDNYLVGQGSHLTGYNKTTSITVYKADPTTGTNTGLTWTNAGFGDAIGVNITATWKPVIPGLVKLTGSYTLSGTCVMTVESNELQ
jgi:Flp pilus assembly protein TadG